MSGASVVVATSGRPERLAACLAALRAQTAAPDEVVVVDNGAAAGVAALAEAAGARCVREPVRGASRARNAGARAARGELVAFVDDDAVPEPGWLAAHQEALADRAVDVTTGRVLPIPAGRWEVGDDLGPEPFTVDAGTPQWFERANFGGLGLGSNMVFRRRVFDAGWGFRESLGPGTPMPGEEHYAFFDALRRGHRLRYVPEAVVAHHVPADAAAVAAYRRRMLRGGAAYALMLLVEEPRFRRRVLRYCLQGLGGGGTREWRAGEGASAPTRGEVADAVLHGPLLYLRSRLAS